MSVVAKAFGLLQHFSPQTPELGLSQLARLEKRDKATTYRHLSALEEIGMVEQNPETKAYRIGPGVLHLARLREATVPRGEGAKAPLRALAERTGETAHASILSGVELHALASVEAQTHGTRAVIDLDRLPLHATASGVCALAFGPEGLMHAALNAPRAFTAHTPQDAETLRAMVAEARGRGFAQSDRGLEEDISGFAAPLYDASGDFAGTVAVACVAVRLTDALRAEIAQGLAEASRAITQNWGGRTPDRLERLWAAAIDEQDNKEHAP